MCRRERGNNKFSAVLPQFQNTAAPVKNGVIGENMRSKYWQLLTLYSLQVKGAILMGYEEKNHKNLLWKQSERDHQNKVNSANLLFEY